MKFDNMFGMFIHWGLYAQTGVQEQVYARFDWPREKYESLIHDFNPVDYDPEQWVLMAKDAGMRYICFTTKHHDGFCMWDTKYTDYNIMNTPYGKDVLNMLADACDKHGMKLSLYYSNPDWHHPLGYNSASSHQWKAVDKRTVDTEGYREYIRNQLTELLTGYGPIYTLFWDIPPKISDPSINELARKLQPGILINDRGFDKGDFSTPEREYKAIDAERFERRTEACNSLGRQSWGYRVNEDFYSVRHLEGAIDRIMAMGGSYLLNVGPNGKGVVESAYAERLSRIGEWYKRVRQSFEGCDASPFPLKERSNPCIVTENGGKTYVHFYNGLNCDAVELSGYPCCPKEVTLLNNGAKPEFAVEAVPEFFSRETGRAEEQFLHIRGIPVDDLNEPLVIEIEWQ